MNKRYLYHITRWDLVLKILDEGLDPIYSKRDRVFAITGDDQDSMLVGISPILEIQTEQSMKNLELSILKIDTEHPSVSAVKWMEEYDVPEIGPISLVTDRHVSPLAIELHRRISRKEYETIVTDWFMASGHLDEKNVMDQLERFLESSEEASKLPT